MEKVKWEKNHLRLNIIIKIYNKICCFIFYIFSMKLFILNKYDVYIHKKLKKNKEDVYNIFI